MAVDAYISAAASQLRDAADHLQGEIHSIQADAYDTERRLEGEMSHAEYDKVRTRTELEEHKTVHDRINPQSFQARLSELEQLINRNKVQISKQSQDAARVVQQKTSLMNRIQQLASQLESLAASAR